MQCLSGWQVQNHIKTMTFVLQKLMLQIKADFDSKLKFNSFHSSGAPPSSKVRADYYFSVKSCYDKYESVGVKTNGTCIFLILLG